jgi:hypothetical protein
MGALTQLYAGTTPQGLALNGKVTHHHVYDHQALANFSLVYVAFRAGGLDAGRREES